MDTQVWAHLYVLQRISARSGTLVHTSTRSCTCICLDTFTNAQARLGTAARSKMLGCTHTHSGTCARTYRLGCAHKHSGTLGCALRCWVHSHTLGHVHVLTPTASFHTLMCVHSHTSTRASACLCTLVHICACSGMAGHACACFGMLARARTHRCTLKYTCHLCTLTCLGTLVHVWMCSCLLPHAGAHSHMLRRACTCTEVLAHTQTHLYMLYKHLHTLVYTWTHSRVTGMLTH